MLRLLVVACGDLEYRVFNTIGLTMMSMKRCVTCPGDMFSIGNNTHGQLGIGDKEKQLSTTLCQVMVDQLRIVDISASVNRSFAVTQRKVCHRFLNKLFKNKFNQSKTMGLTYNYILTYCYNCF